MIKKESIIKLLSLNIRNVVNNITKINYDNLQEIRLRVNAPLTIVYNNQEYFVNSSGELSKIMQNSVIVQHKEIRETMEYISNFSLYAFEEEIRQGYLTVQGGHRIGLAGKVILEKGQVKNIKHIAFVNIRIANEVKGVANKVMKYLIDYKNNNLYHTMIISPPRCGKTTLLRDIIRQASNGVANFKGLNIGVVDERSEIGGSYLGVPQNDLGIRTDLIDSCPKAEGMLMLIRSMSPAIIAVDEIGSYDDINAIDYVINSGCKIICTVHGNSIEDVMRKPVLNKLVNSDIFERYIVLCNSNHIGEIKGIYDIDKKILKEGAN